MSSWNKALLQLQLLNVHFPGTVIAGGAIRDLVLDRVERDFDFYVPATREEFLKIFCEKNLEELKGEKFGEQYETNKLLQAVFDDKRNSEFQYMLVAVRLDTNKNLIEEFGCSSSEAMMLPDESIYLHPNFTRFLQTGDIVFSAKHKARPKYFEKMKRYFSEQFRLRIEDEVTVTTPAP